jgi:Ni/Co efflux regulator RcnB
MKKGDWVETPRFCKVKIQKVYRSNERAWNDGYTEPTHYRDSEYHIRGKHTGPNRMIFAAIKRG